MQQIDQASNSEFFPDLDTLDQMMASVHIDSANSAPLPSTGLPHSEDASPVNALAPLAVLAGLLLVISGLVLQRTRRPE